MVELITRSITVSNEQVVFELIRSPSFQGAEIMQRSFTRSGSINTDSGHEPPVSTGTRDAVDAIHAQGLGVHRGNEHEFGFP